MPDTLPTVAQLHGLLLEVARGWEENPGGEHYDSGHCDSEYAATDLKRFVERPDAKADAVAEMEDLARMLNYPGAATGAWQARQWAAQAGRKWGATDLERAIGAAGWSNLWDLAKLNLQASEIEFLWRSRNASRSMAQALHHDVQAWLDDPGSGAGRMGLGEQVQQALDEHKDGSFLRTARALRQVLSRHDLIGSDKPMTGLRQVLAVFSNPDSPVFGMFPNPEAVHPERRYRAADTDLSRFHAPTDEPAQAPRPGPRMR